jgi:hypothetical protein
MIAATAARISSTAWRSEPETDAVLTYIPLEPENQFTPQARQVINVPAGDRYNTSVSIFNTNRPFAGELELVAIGLPEGVTMRAPRITASMPRVPWCSRWSPGTRHARQADRYRRAAGGRFGRRQQRERLRQPGGSAERLPSK